MALPEAPPQPWIVPRPAVPRGALHEETLRSARLGNERPIWVSTPPGYPPATAAPYPLLVLLDGRAYTSRIPAPTILDNLTAAGALPPLVAVFVANLGPQTRTRELTCNPAFLAFLTEELLPWAQQAYHVTTDPGCTLVGGLSLGGLTAAFAALRRPDRFGLVLSQSGAFSWSPPDDAEGAEWLTREVAGRARTARTAAGARAGGAGS